MESAELHHDQVIRLKRKRRVWGLWWWSSDKARGARQHTYSLMASHTPQQTHNDRTSASLPMKTEGGIWVSNGLEASKGGLGRNICLWQLLWRCNQGANAGVWEDMTYNTPLISRHQTVSTTLTEQVAGSQGEDLFVSVNNALQSVHSWGQVRPNLTLACTTAGLAIDENLDLRWYLRCQCPSPIPSPDLESRWKTTHRTFNGFLIRQELSFWIFC